MMFTQPSTASASVVSVNPVSAVPAPPVSDFVASLENVTVPVVTILSALPEDFRHTVMFLALGDLPRESWPTTDNCDRENWEAVIRLASETIAHYGMRTIRQWESVLFDGETDLPDEVWSDERSDLAARLAGLLESSPWITEID
jgi:hypothetical protein